MPKMRTSFCVTGEHCKIPGFQPWQWFITTASLCSYNWHYIQNNHRSGSTSQSEITSKWLSDFPTNLAMKITARFSQYLSWLKCLNDKDFRLGTNWPKFQLKGSDETKPRNRVSVQPQPQWRTVNEWTVKSRELHANPQSPVNPTEFQFQSKGPGKQRPNRTNNPISSVQDCHHSLFKFQFHSQNNNPFHQPIQFMPQNHSNRSASVTVQEAVSRIWVSIHSKPSSATNHHQIIMIFQTRICPDSWFMLDHFLKQTVMQWWWLFIRLGHEVGFVLDHSLAQNMMKSWSCFIVIVNHYTWWCETQA